MLRRKGLALSLGLVLLIALAVAPAFAATSDSGSHNVTFSNKATIDLTLSGGNYAFGDVDPVASPFTSANDVLTANVKCNSGWTLKVKGDTNFVSGANNIPIGRLAWDKDDGASWDAMTTTDATVATGTKTASSGVDTKTEYRLSIDYNDDVADGYSAAITYTATTP